MKAIKIIFALLAAGWAILLIPKLLATLSADSSAYNTGRAFGSVAGILLASAISFSLFRSASKS